jgi:hypothetical protein
VLVDAVRRGPRVKDVAEDSALGAHERGAGGGRGEVALDKILGVEHGAWVSEEGVGLTLHLKAAEKVGVEKLARELGEGFFLALARFAIEDFDL